MNETIMVSKWHKELEVYSRIKNAIILEGNIYDSFEYPDGELKGAWLDIRHYLENFFLSAGYRDVIFYNHIDGFTASEEEMLDRFAKMVGMNASDGAVSAKFEAGENDAPRIIRDALTQREESIVIIMDMASRTIIAPDHLSAQDLKCYTVLKQALLGAADAPKADEGERIGNMLVFITDKKNDLPSWMYLNLNRVQGIRIDYPDAEQRRKFLTADNMKRFFDPDIYAEDYPGYEEKEDEWNSLLDRFVARTEGFTFLELMQLRKLCISRKIHIHELCSVVDLYTYGIKDNPWSSPSLYKRIGEGEELIKKRVKGQDAAVRQSLDVIKRAISGLSNVKSAASPKGVLFFAGPTGTGKTECAKTLAELVFGDESACIRFDMSEYMHDNSDQRLFGAPPGYVGYEAGGQLTNAVLKNPFSILLFDEIEKASPSIMDKFLQILEDGRMTDGQGNTAYFSDSIIIFTSNLGIYTKDRFGQRHENVSKDMESEEVRKKVRDAISDYFKAELGRPEILNRIGENIVVFDYISEEAAGAIMDARLEKIGRKLQQDSGIKVDFTDIREKLFELCLNNLENGGRGINNIIEKALINPLARMIFDYRILPGTSMHLCNLREKNGQFVMDFDRR